MRSVLLRLFLLGFLACGVVSAADPGPGDTAASAIPGDAFALRRFEWIPEFPAPRLLPVRFPDSTPAARVLRVVHHAGRLWMAAVPRGDTNLPPDAGRLWAFEPGRNRLLPVRGLIEQHGVFAIQGRPDGLWLALEGGVAVLDPATLVIDPFGPAQGITSSTFAGLAAAGDRLFALSATGAGYGLQRDGRAWARLGGEPDLNPRRATRWTGLAGAGDWLLAWAPDALSLRHQAGAVWQPVPPEITGALPTFGPVAWRAAAGDGDGGFWIGSSAGLHFLVAETGSIEHRTATADVRVPGGLGIAVPAGFQPGAGAALQVSERMAEGIRARMRARARVARMRLESGRPIDPVTPIHRIPGPVSVLAADGPHLWVVTRDGADGERSRVGVFHAPSRRWIGWFPVALPVLDIAVDDRFLWLALDATAAPRGAPLVAVDKRPLLAVPADRWVEDTLDPVEVGARLAELPVLERAVLAFFSGDARRTVELLRHGLDTPDPEVLFLMAFAHDGAGLDDAVERDRHLERLHRLFPQSPHAIATRHLRPAPPGVAETPGTVAPPPAVPPVSVPPPVPAPVVPPPAPDAVPVPGSVPVPGAAADPAPPDPAAILARRDLNKDGRLNLVEWRLWRGPGADLREYDANGDGHIDAGELAAVLAAGR